MGVPFRCWIGVMVFWCAFTYYTTRVNLSVSIVSMTKGKTKGVPYCVEINNQRNNQSRSEEQESLPDYGPRYDWDERIQGQVLGAYFYGYMSANLFAGLIAQRFGPLRVISIAFLTTSIANTLSVFAADLHFIAFMCCRIVLGCCGSLVYPSLQALIAQWAPPNEKGKFMSCLMGNVLGSCLTLQLVAIVTVRFGWHWGFYLVSIENLTICLIFFFTITDLPEHHKWVSAEEIEYIKASHQGAVTVKKVSTPFKDIFTNIPCLMYFISTVANDWGLNIQLTLSPKFLNDVIGFDLDQSGGLASIPPLARMFFGLGFGFFADYLLVKEKARKVVVRKCSSVFSHVLPGIMVIAISFLGCDEYIVILILLSVSLGFNGAVVQNNLINSQDLAPNYAPFLYSMANFFSGTTGFIVTALNAEFTQTHNGIKEWSYTFLLGGSVYCIGGILWICFGSVEEQGFNRKNYDA